MRNALGIIVIAGILSVKGWSCDFCSGERSSESSATQESTNSVQTQGYPGGDEELFSDSNRPVPLFSKEYYKRSVRAAKMSAKMRKARVVGGE